MFGIDDAIAIPALASFGSGLINNFGASQRQEDAQAFSAAQYATRYQTQVKDMQAAGLNPMLSYMQAPGPSPTSSAASSAGMPDIGSTINQSRLASAQVANIDADTANKDAQANLLEAQAAAAWASAGQGNANINLINETVNKVRQETQNLGSENLRILAVVENLAVEREKLIKEGRNLDDVQGQIRAATAKLVAELPVLRSEAARNIAAAGASNATGSKLAAETSLLHLDKQAADKFNNMGRNMGQAKPVFDILNAVIRAGKGK